MYGWQWQRERWAKKLVITALSNSYIRHCKCDNIQVKTRRYSACYGEAYEQKPEGQPPSRKVHVQSLHDIQRPHISKSRPLWENELNKGISWAYHFSTWLVSMQKERHQRKIQLHMQTWIDTCIQNKKAMLDWWRNALLYDFMNPKWASLHLHVLSSIDEHNAHLVLRPITHTFRIWNYHQQAPSAQTL